jgi:hypothetical protein
MFPSLQVQTPPQPNILQSVSGLMNIRSSITENALRAAQAQQAQAAAADTAAQTQIRQRVVQGQQQLTDLFHKDPKAAEAMGKGDFTAAYSAGIPEEVINTTRTNLTDARSKTATTDKAELENRQTANGMIQSSLASLSDPNFKEEDLHEQWPNVLQHLSSEGALKHIDPKLVAGLYQNPPQTKEDITKLEGVLGVLKGVTDSALEQKNKQANTAEATARGAQAQAAADLDKYKLNLLQGGAQNDTGAAAIMDRLFAGKPELRAQADAVYQAGKAAKPLEPGAGVDAVKAFYDEQVSKPAGAAATVNAETPAKVAQEKALIPVEAASANAKAFAEIPARVKEQAAIAANSPEMFAGITDPMSRRKAQGDYQTLTEQYLDKAQSAQQLKDFVAATQSGNKAAPALVGIEELRSIVNRVNRPELDKVSTQAGNDLDKVKGWLGGHIEGQPIPSDVLNGMSNIADIENRNSRSAYENKVQALGATYGGSVKPVNPPAPAHVQAADTAAIGSVIPMPGGRYVKKTGANAFIETDKNGTPLSK